MAQGHLNLYRPAMAGRAFGMSLDSSRATAGRDYLFQIGTAEDGQLELRVDVYLAFYRPASQEPLDAGAWDDMLLHFNAPATRRGFHSLSRLARGLLAGRTMRIADGTRFNITPAGEES